DFLPPAFRMRKAGVAEPIEGFAALLAGLLVDAALPLPGRTAAGIAAVIDVQRRSAQQNGLRSIHRFFDLSAGFVDGMPDAPVRNHFVVLADPRDVLEAHLIGKPG